MAENAGGNKQGWAGGPNFIRLKRWGANTSNSGPVGKRNRRAYPMMVRAGAENAMTKGFLFGLPFNRSTKTVTPVNRGTVIWPGLPSALRWVDLNPTPWSRVEAARINAEQAALFRGKVHALSVSG